MTWVRPEDARSPKSHWRLHRVLLDKGAGEAAYALGQWQDMDGQWRPRLAVRWNGTDEKPAGNPQSRGMPTWTMLDNEIHEAVLDALSRVSERQEDRLQPVDWVDARRYLGLPIQPRHPIE